ncbi:MAG TPA: hypothetical protein VFC21_03770 [Bryobacteraceae bacterium]|nr:hypothetical protein [Bryobacteraceae bacterium]
MSAPNVLQLPLEHGLLPELPTEAGSRILTHHISSNTTDHDFLLSIGVEPYEPDIFKTEWRTRRRDRLIQAVAVVQLLAIAAALAWTSL